MTFQSARDLLERTHAFPGSYTIKAIGLAQEDFVGRVVTAARVALVRAVDVRYSIRSTPRGEHVAVTLDLTVLTPEEIIRVYQALQVLQGMKFLL